MEIGQDRLIRVRTWLNNDESEDTLFYLNSSQANDLNTYVLSGHADGELLEQINAIVAENPTNGAGQDAEAHRGHIAGLWAQAHGRRLDPTTYTVTGF